MEENISFGYVVSKNINFQLCYTDFCSKWHPTFYTPYSVHLKREFVTFLVTSSFPLVQLADSMIYCKSSHPCNFCQQTLSCIWPHQYYSKDVRSGVLAGQACGPKWVQGMRKQCLQQVGVSMKVVH